MCSVPIQASRASQISMRDGSDDWMYKLLGNAVRFYTEIFISFSTISAKFLTEKIALRSATAATNEIGIQNTC